MHFALKFPSAFLGISKWLKIFAPAIKPSKSTKQTLVITNHYHNKPISPSDIYSVKHFQFCGQPGKTYVLYIPGD